MIAVSEVSDTLNKMTVVNGSIKWFNAKQRYGFIIASPQLAEFSGVDFFFPSSFSAEDNLSPGDAVQFRPHYNSKRGKFMALDIARITPAPEGSYCGAPAASPLMDEQQDHSEQLGAGGVVFMEKLSGFIFYSTKVTAGIIEDLAKVTSRLDQLSDFSGTGKPAGRCGPRLLTRSVSSSVNILPEKALSPRKKVDASTDISLAPTSNIASSKKVDAATVISPAPTGSIVNSAWSFAQHVRKCITSSKAGSDSSPTTQKEDYATRMSKKQQAAKEQRSREDLVEQVLLDQYGTRFYTSNQSFQERRRKEVLDKMRKEESEGSPDTPTTFSQEVD